MFKNKNFKIIIYSALLIFPLLISSAAPVIAAADIQNHSIDSFDEEEPLDIEEALQKLTLWFEKQSESLSTAGDMLNKTQVRIEDLQNEGKETGFLEVSLIDFQEAVAQAQQVHDLAGQILNRKPGFDDSGNLEDENIAKVTISNAAKLLQNCQATLKSAFEQAKNTKEEFFLPLSPDAEQLEELLRKFIDNQDSIQNTLDNSEEKLDTAAVKLEELKNEGEDIFEFENVLEEIDGLLEKSNSLFLQYQDLINSHPGFNTDLLVEDHAQAKETILSLREISQKIQKELLLARRISEVNRRLFFIDFSGN